MTATTKRLASAIATASILTSGVLGINLLAVTTQQMPVCYMQTFDGTTFNLSSMCGKQPTQPAVICPEITDPKRRAL